MGWELTPEPGLLIAEFPKVGDGHRARGAFHPFGPGTSRPTLTFGCGPGIPCRTSPPPTLDGNLESPGGPTYCGTHCAAHELAD